MILSVTGHRPDTIQELAKQHGWLYSHLCEAIIDEMKATIIRLAPTRMIVGMALGVDTFAASLAFSLDIPFTAAIPFTGHDRYWPEHTRRKYRSLLAVASARIIVGDGLPVYEAMQKRNEWMVDHSDHLLAVYAGVSGGTANCIAYADRVKSTKFRTTIHMEHLFVSKLF